jgi:hypothetical protein
VKYEFLLKQPLVERVGPFCVPALVAEQEEEMLGGKLQHLDKFSHERINGALVRVDGVPRIDQH